MKLPLPRAAWRVSLISAFVATTLVTASPSLTAQSGVITITSPVSNTVLATGPDFATDVLGDPWDMSNAGDIAVDPMQNKGWVNLGFSAGRVGGTLATVDGASNGSHITLLERAYAVALNPGRTGAKFPINSSVYTKLAFKMGSSRSDQFPRVFWFHRDLGDSGAGNGWRYVDPSNPSPAGDQIFVVDLNTLLAGGSPWNSAPVRGFSLYPNSSAVGYNVTFDWVRLTTGDGNPASAVHQITWSGGSGTSTIQVIDAGGATMTVASGISGTSYNWYYGTLPPGTYTLRITRGGVAAPDRTFRINAPPAVRITDPDEPGGEDFATAVLGNAWDMNDAADTNFDPAIIVDHLISRTFSGGQFHGTSDGVAIAVSQDGVPVGDPQVYFLTNEAVINTSRYRYLTFGLQNDGSYDLLRGSVARVFWGSATGPGAPYNLTVTKDIITWPGMRTYTIDLASLTTAPGGGLESVGAATRWATNNVRFLRIDPHEFAEVRNFHFDFVKLAAMDETAGGSFTIRFAASDADGDPVSVTLYYDTDTNPTNGMTQIASGVSAATGQHTWNTGAVPAGVYYVYAVASDGRNAIGTYSTGPVRVSAPATDPLMSLDSPPNNTSTGQPFQISGWAIDRAAATGTGVDRVHVYAFPNPGSGQPAIFLGGAAYGQTRGDIGAAFGSQFTNSGFTLQTNYLPPGPYLIAAYARSTVSGGNQVRTASITVVPGPLMAIDQPAAGVSRSQPFTLSGWAIDTAASSGTGVDTLHVWAYPNPGSGQAAVFVGVAQYGSSRPDVGSAYGSQFTNSGYSLQVKGLAPATYQFVVFLHSTVTGTFRTWSAVTLPVQNTPVMALDSPVGGTVPRSFVISGWAADLAAKTGTGVDAIHVWAYKDPGSGTPAQFLGVATYGVRRDDVAAALGSSQFALSGYSLPVSGLASGVYDVVVFARSTVSASFDNWRVVRISVP